MLIEWRNRFLKGVLFLGLLGVLAFLWAQPINLTAVDIGRHIKNGELICQGQVSLLYKNYYSFTHPDYPFINHHWFFGVISFILWKLIGFSGLTISYVLMSLGAFLLFYQTARRYAGFPLVLLLSALALTVMTDRREIRPEGFSVLCLGIYFYLLHRFKWGGILLNWLLIILLGLQVAWVNTHIFFFMGPLLIAVFLWDAYLSKAGQPYKNDLWKLLIVALLINLANPSGLWGMLTPLNIFKRFGYMLAENQHLFFMMKRFPNESAYYWYLVISIIAVIGALLAIKREGFKKHLPSLVLMLFMGSAGFKAVRLMPFFALFFIPLAARFYGPYFRNLSFYVKGLLILVAVVLVAYQFKHTVKNNGIGLMPGVNASAEFYKSQGLKGPIFSNYDIGGYLIFHLAGREGMFVDNRQEAYPLSFLQDVYVAMQDNPAVWQQMKMKYGFNIIYFYRHDMTPWGQKFLIDRISDNEWAPVFVDAYTIIFARRGSINENVIKHFELPRAMFAVTHNS